LGLTRGLLSSLAGFLLTAYSGGGVFVCGADTEPSPAIQQPGNSGSLLPALGDESSYQGLTVKEVHIANLSSSQDQKVLLDLISQKVGEPLDRERLRQSMQILYATGRFSDIRAEAERSDAGVVISFLTSPNYFIGEVTVDGTPARPSETQVANASKLQLGEVFTSQRVDRALLNIKQLMEENGYYRSTATVEEHRYPETQQIGIKLHLHSGAQAQVGKVTVTGNHLYSGGQIQDIARLHPGDLVSAQRVTTALDRLRKKYQKHDRWLAQVTLAGRSYRSEANAVDYTLVIDPGPTVNIIVEGFHLKRSVLKQNVPVFEEDALDDDLLNEGRRNLLNYLQGRGYFEAKVTLKRKFEPASNRLTVIYDIDAGARHKLVGLHIAGNKYFRDELLRARMQTQPAPRLGSVGRYSQGLLSADVRGLEDLYRANGFAQIKITSSVEDDYHGRKNELAVTLKVDEGPQTRVGDFHLLGNAAFSEAQLSPYLNTAQGQLFSEYYISQDRESILNYYFNHGFPSATFEATAKPIPDVANEMTVTFTIHEGRQVSVDRVLVSGLNFTRPFVVQRELQMHSGDPLSQVDMLKTQQQLYDLGIFSQVDTAVQNPEGNEPVKNVLVQVKEAKRYTFNYGGGFEFQTGQPGLGQTSAQGSTGVSPLVSLQVSRLNFRGRDHTLTFDSRVGSLQQRGLISYDAPRWFNSSEWKLSISAFYDNSVDVTTFSSQRLEGTFQGEQTISKASTMDYRFTYRRVKASNIAISTDLIPILSLPVRVGEPGFSYIRNTRDNDLETTKGTYNTVDAGVASSYFGSQADFSRILIQNSTYYAFGKNRPADKKYVFARSLRVGVEDLFGGTILPEPGSACPSTGSQSCMPLAERFFSGGGNSHRGFGLNQAGPRDPFTGFPLGGTALFLNNLELRFPPATLPFVQDNMSFAIFHDAGNVFTDGRDMFNSLLRWHQDKQTCELPATAQHCNYNYISHAVGVGVRYKTPVGPVRFDFGYNLNPPIYPKFVAVGNTSNPSHEFDGASQLSHFNVYFSIGQTF
jgi:outer membrane protein insertion porin family